MGFLDRLGQTLGHLAEPGLSAQAAQRLEQAETALDGGDLEAAGDALALPAAEAPEHPRVAFALARLHARQGDDARAAEALVTAARGAQGPLAARVAWERGRLALRRGELARAIRELRKAADTLDEALPDLWRAFAQDGQPRAALVLARRQVGRLEGTPLAPRDADLLVEVGQLALAADDPAQAQAAFERASSADPSHAAAFLGLSRARRLRGDLAGAHEAVLRALGLDPDDRAARLQLAELHAAAESWPLAADAFAQLLDEHAPERAFRAGMDAALRAGQLERAGAWAARAGDDPVARAILARPATGDVLPDDLPALLRRAAAHPALAPLCDSLGRELDRPMALAVVGEFNVGKSSFVNALLGEEIAETGVTPTTATLHVFRFGPTRRARVHLADDRSLEAAFSEVAATIERVGSAQVRFVEWSLPLAVLERVHVIDTPGLNSLLPEHEAQTRKFLDEADAIVWLFSVDQAGKRSEAAILGQLSASVRARTVAVLNKVDRADAAEVAEVLEHLQKTLGDRVSAVQPFSARLAQAGGGHLEELRALLEARLFSRSRDIVRARAAERLAASALAARIAPEQLRLGHVERVLALGAQARALGALVTELHARVLPVERGRLVADLETALASAAREVLGFLRPGRLFSGHGATPADRDYLRDSLEDAIAAVLAASRARLAPALGALAAPTAAAFDRATAFFRGTLRGGRLGGFFDGVLPSLALDEAAIARALERALGLDLEGELWTPLSVALDAAALAERTTLEQAARQAHAEALAVGWAETGPLSAIAEAAARHAKPC